MNQELASKSRQVVEQFWAAMQSNDFRIAGGFLHVNCVIEWPQSGERIRGRANFVMINENYPTAGRWEFSLQRLIAEGDEVVTVVSVRDEKTSGTAITFSTVENGLIVRQTEYWPDPFPAADWRAPWVERF